MTDNQKYFIGLVEQAVNQLNQIMANAAYHTGQRPSFELAKDICTNNGAKAREQIINNAKSRNESDDEIIKRMKKFDDFMGSFGQNELRFIDFISLSDGFNNYRFYISQENMEALERQIQIHGKL